MHLVYIMRMRREVLFFFSFLSSGFLSLACWTKAGQTLFPLFTDECHAFPTELSCNICLQELYLSKRFKKKFSFLLFFFFFYFKGRISSFLVYLYYSILSMYSWELYHVNSGESIWFSPSALWPSATPFMSSYYMENDRLRFVPWGFFFFFPPPENIENKKANCQVLKGVVLIFLG